MRWSYRFRISGLLAAAGLGAFASGCAHRSGAEFFTSRAHIPNNQTVLVTRNPLNSDQCVAFPDDPDAPHVSASKKHRVKWVLTLEPLGSTLSIEFTGALQPFKVPIPCKEDECTSGPARKEAAPKDFDPAYKNSIPYSYTCVITPPPESGQAPAKGDPTVMVDF